MQSDLHHIIYKSYFKSFAVLILVLMSSNFGFSQFATDDYQIQFGNQRKTSVKEGADVIIGNDADGIYVMNVSDNDYHFYYYGNDMNVIKENVVELIFQKHKLKFEYVVQMEDEMYVLASYLNRRDNEKLLIRYYLNKDLLTLNHPKLINVSSYDGFSSAQVPNYQFRLSENERKLLCKINYPVKNILYTKFSLAVFDSQMSLLWESTPFLSKDKKHPFEMVDLQLAENSDVYLLMKHIDKTKTYRRVDVNYTFHVWVFDSLSTERHKEIDLAIIGQHVNDVKLEVFHDGSFQVVGLFSDKYYNQKGVFKRDFDAAFNLVNEFADVFSTEFIIQYETPKEREKLRRQARSGDQLAFTSLYIDDLVKNEDGSLTLIGESYQQYRTVNSDANSGTTFTEHYENGNILLIKFSNQGGIEWLEQIPKAQYTINDYGFYSGYSAMQLSDGEIVIIFNDEPKNNYYQSNGRVYRWNGSKRKTDIIMYQVGVEGRVKRSKLFNAAHEEVLCYPRGSFYISPNQVVVSGRSRKGNKYIKLTF